MVRRAYPRIQCSVTDVSLLNGSVPNTVEIGLSASIVTSANLVRYEGQSYDARIAGAHAGEGAKADAGTLFREAREQA